MANIGIKIPCKQNRQHPHNPSTTIAIEGKVTHKAVTPMNHQQVFYNQLEINLQIETLKRNYQNIYPT